METFNKFRISNFLSGVVSFFDRKYWLFLLAVVLISYGQLVFMQPWQDDNALFFKLAHIEEPAGFLGKGVFGEGAYKYTAFFYYPLYLIFGHQTIPYFILSLIFYFLSVLSVYLLAKRIMDLKAARFSALVYAAGYIASDGVIRLFNSVGTSLSVILVSFLFYFYFSYSQQRKVVDYFSGLIFFLLATELVRYRLHYLIGVIAIFEIIFSLGRGKVIKSLIGISLRLAPFLFIFYKYFVENADARSREAVVFLKSIVSGEFYNLYGFFASFANLIVPDKLSDPIYQPGRLVYILAVLPASALIWYLSRSLPGKKIAVLLFSFICGLWYFVNKIFFITPFLNLDARGLWLSFLGGVTLIFLIVLFFTIERKFKQVYFWLLSWLIINLASYSAYNPTFVLVTINRYLAHSFLAWALFLGIVSQKNKMAIGVLGLVVLNTFLSFTYQRRVILERSRPVKKFYQQLKTLLPVIEKGDLLYFEVADDSKGYFADAFSVAQMPETTAIAWRYGLDRYDFRLAENYANLEQIIVQEKVPIEKIHSFYYSQKNGLTSTTEEFRDIVTNGRFKQERFSQPLKQKIDQATDGLIYQFPEDVSCVRRPLVSLYLSVEVDSGGQQLLSQINFPINQVMAYQKAKNYHYSHSRVFTSSDWRERPAVNLLDQNPDTAWQADRVIWSKEGGYFGLDLGKEILIDRLVWLNAFANNTPTEYVVEVSVDKEKWQMVAEVKEVRRIESGLLQEITFSPVKTRFIRMVMSESLNSDSPGISESWVVPAGFEEMTAQELESYSSSPEVRLLERRSMVGISWQSNASSGWQSDNLAKFEMTVDGRERKYSTLLPCRGTELSAIKLSGFQFPLNITFSGFEVSYP